MIEVDWSKKSYSAQFLIMRLDARMEANASGSHFNAEAFKVLLPTDETNSANPKSQYTFHQLAPGKPVTDIRQFDANNDGYINNQEHHTLYQHQASLLGAQSDGIVSSDEFVELLESDDFSKIALELIFERFDFDKDGELSPEEFEQAVQYLVEEAERKRLLSEERKRQFMQEQVQSMERGEAIVSEGAFINQVFAARIPENFEDSEDASPHPGGIEVALSISSQLEHQRALLGGDRIENQFLSGTSRVRK